MEAGVVSIYVFSNHLLSGRLAYCCAFELTLLVLQLIISVGVGFLHSQ